MEARWIKYQRDPMHICTINCQHATFDMGMQVHVQVKSADKKEIINIAQVPIHY